MALVGRVHSLHSLSSCPDAQILFPVPWRKKTPHPASGAGLQPICWGERSPSLSQEILEKQLEDPCAQGDPSTRLRRHFGLHG